MNGQCQFCFNNVKEISHAEVGMLRKFLSGQAKIKSRKRTGICMWHQRRLAKAIKRARNLGLLPFTDR